MIEAELGVDLSGKKIPPAATNAAYDAAAIQLQRYKDLTEVDVTQPLPNMTLSRSRLDWLEARYQPNFDFIQKQEEGETPSLFQLKQVALGDLRPAVQTRFRLEQEKDKTLSLSRAAAAAALGGAGEALDHARIRVSDNEERIEILRQELARELWYTGLPTEVETEQVRMAMAIYERRDTGLTFPDQVYNIYIELLQEGANLSTDIITG